jgi:AcrR family transcriptional regulator
MEQQISRKERERLARRKIMLDAARVVIAEKGYKRATLDEIAQKAEFGKGTIYNYFPGGKNEILFAILDDVYDDLYEISRSTLGSNDRSTFRERLTRYVEAILRYFMQQWDLFVIVMKEANRIAFGDEEAKALYFKGQMDRLVGVIVPVVSDAIARGDVKPYPAESVAHMVLGNIHGYLRYSCFSGIGGTNGEDGREPESRKAAELLCGILLDGLAPAGTAADGLDGNQEEWEEVQ